MATLKLGLNAGSGFSSLSQNLRQVSEKAKGLFHDTDRLQDSTDSLSQSFGALGIGALGALGVIAAIAPSLAGSLASLEVSGFRLAEAIGKAAAPAFEQFAGVIEGVAGFLEQNPWAAELTAGLLGVAAVVKVGGLLYSGLAGVGQLMLGLVSGPAAPILLLIAGLWLAHEAFADLVPEGTKKAIEEFYEPLGPEIGGAAAAGTIAVAGIGEQLGDVAGPAIQESWDRSGITAGLQALGSILGLNEMSAEDIAAENFKNTNPIIQAAGTASILIQIIDQDGEKRDQVVVTGGGGGTR